MSRPAACLENRSYDLMFATAEGVESFVTFTQLEGDLGGAGVVKWSIFRADAIKIAPLKRNRRLN